MAGVLWFGVRAGLALDIASRRPPAQPVYDSNENLSRGKTIPNWQQTGGLPR
ncbi:hypothetical protein AAFN86_10490 [Roseomonas sp. CAU 1739]|uniref:hypothetical protein n=1 Tax=Roseomonas sp. CAU 1739 TaxID=3140364 RepID=UPI00325BEA99